MLIFDNRDYQVRVEGAPYQDGNDWVYTVRLASNQNAYVPGKYLLPGCRVSRSHSMYEEYSEEADIVNYSTPFKLRNCLTTLRLSYDATGDAYSSVMCLSLQDPNSNRTTTLWTTMQEWIALRQFQEMIDHALVYGQYNMNADGTTDLKGSNGRPVYSGAGLFAQISPANIRTYTKLTPELLQDFLTDLSYNMLGFNNRKFVAMTGEFGMREFSRILENRAAQFNLIDTKFITGSGQELTLGGQFVSYKMYNGIEVSLMHQPLFDNDEENREYHPISGKPLSSYDFLFLDVSHKAGNEQNIVKVVRKDRELVMGSTHGLVGPKSGHSKSIGNMMSNAKDGYSVHLLAEVGLMVKNPTSCGWLRFTVAD